MPKQTTALTIASTAVMYKLLAQICAANFVAHSADYSKCSLSAD